MPTAVAVQQNSNQKWWSWSNFLNYLKSLFPAKDAASNSMAGNLEVLGSLTAPNQAAGTNSVVTDTRLAQMAAIFFKSRVYDLGSGWQAFAASGSAYLAMGPNYLGLNDSDGTGAVSIFPSGGIRGTWGNIETTSSWGISQFDNTKYRLFIDLAATVARWSYANCSFSFAVGDHYYGVTFDRDTVVNPSGTYKLFGLRCVNGQLTAWVKNGSGAATSSAVLATLTDAYIGKFILECSAGTLKVYRNGVLLGTLAGAPTGLGGPLNLYVNMTCAWATMTEMFIQQAAITWE